ncbi:MAG: DUF3179 domain-containing protein [Pirellulales bacterium]|jgi:hypothetical protein|nr:DUF3179 domain-containing protein [Pirellulales bacterium]
MRFGALLFLLSVVGTAFAVEPVSLIAKPEAFETLVNPECSHCRIEAKRRAKELRDDDRVLCWIRGYSDGGAIPIRFFLNSYRVISDSYGVFVYDPDAGFARGFAPSYDFKFHGWRNGVMVMRHKDGTLYSCLTGRAFEGPKAGTKLEPIPTLASNWGDWMKRYPDTVAYHMFDKYQPTELPKKEIEASLQTRGPVDPRLPRDEIVLGVTSGDKARAYRLADLGTPGMIHDKMGEQDWVVLWNAATKTAAAFESIAQPVDSAQSPKSVRLTREAADSSAPFVDTETRSHWDIAGRATDGELKGSTLKWLDGTQVKWFAWAAEYPETSIYQANGKPQ